MLDGSDAFPLDSSETLDTDLDGIGNNADTDDDGDGVLDAADAFPLDSTETLDTDSDGTGNNADIDDDNDNVIDAVDGFPLVSIGALLDTDSDGRPNDCDSACQASGMAADTDDDGDDVIDTLDGFPLVSIGALLDTDSDGRPNDCDSACQASGMVADRDDDNDGAPDSRQLGKDIDGEASGDLSGLHVSLSSNGSVMAIVAEGNDGNGNDSGQVRLYAWNGTIWQQRGEDINGEASGDFSGSSVSLSSDGSLVAIGASSNGGNGSLSGHVRVYAWDGSGWLQQGGDIDGEASGDRFGVAVSISPDGSVLAVGASLNDTTTAGDGLFNAGHVRVFVWDGSNWLQRGEDIDGEAPQDRSGLAVSLSADGSVVAIGANSNDGNGNLSGHVRLYAWNGSSWLQRGADIDSEAAGDHSGKSVSLSSDGSLVAIGAPQNNGGGAKAGHVRLYAWDGASWLQRGKDIDGEAAGDRSGYLVSLSSDGSVVGVGTDRRDGSDDNSGHVRLYAWDGSNWLQRGGDINGETANGEADSFRSSHAVSLSSDGSLVAIGSGYNNGNGDRAGHARVFFTNDEDAFPLDATELLDTDGDGTGNNADTDDDNDNVLDTVDGFPLISVGDLLDTDVDGLPNDCDSTCQASGMVADNDDDGDSIMDADDVSPLDPSVPEPLIWGSGNWGNVKWQ